MIKLTFLNKYFTWIFQELKSPNKLNNVKELPYEIWVEFKINIIFIRFWIVLTDECKVLEKDKNDESDTAENENWYPNDEFEWWFGPLSWPA